MAADVFIATYGLFKKKLALSALINGRIKFLISSKQVSYKSTIIGWGNKPNTQKIKDFARKHNVPYLHLEDGFIGYLGHPVNKGIGIGLVVDEQGIYYDARTPSDIETLIAQPLTEQEIARVSRVISLIVDAGVTKYNIYFNRSLPSQTHSLIEGVNSNEKVLVVDQVAGDLSIPGSLATEQSFHDMLAAARRNHPNAQLFLRTHPDTRLGRKRGVLANAKLDDVVVLDQACHPHALIQQMDTVYTVSSQMGFEALLLGKPVYCFGMPFYAGWGLTSDVLSIERRGRASLEQLVYAALIKYSRYYNPITNKACEVEEAIQLVRLQQPRAQYETAYLVNFSLWKKAFLQHFARSVASNVKFVNKPPKQIKSNEIIMVWGASYPQLTPVVRIEDGFIRSNGLGANLCKPSSLSFDHSGIYFDSRYINDLEQLLNTKVLSEQEVNRAEQLVEQLRTTGVSKYNVGSSGKFIAKAEGKRIILVVGQVDGDASILTGSPNIKSNQELLYAVKAAEPDAYIVFKPHPDVVSGNRSGDVSTECFATCVDQTVTELPLTAIYPHIDGLHTMTSLSGFEAMLQGVEVHTWGQPFYSGWGLTKDQHPVARRSKDRSLAELVYITLVLYPSYVDWDTKLWSTPEWLIEKIHKQKLQSLRKDSYLKRLIIKTKYLVETLFS